MIQSANLDTLTSYHDYEYIFQILLPPTQCGCTPKLHNKYSNCNLNIIQTKEITKNRTKPSSHKSNISI